MAISLVAVFNQIYILFYRKYLIKFVFIAGLVVSNYR
jgi:hypothetical protein